MKTPIVAILSLLASLSAHGQGAINFNNRVVGVVDAKVLLPDGSGAGAGWTAQLYAGSAATAAAELKPLTPVTTFRTSSTLTLGYVTPTDVIVPGVMPGENAAIVMRVFNGLTFETSLLRGESAPITITLGGGTLPPSDLAGLQGFTVGPNPGTITVTASAGANGSVTPASVIKINGDSQIFIATANANYTVDQWAVDGKVVQSGGIAYTLPSIQASHSITVSFKALAAGGGSVSFNNRVIGIVDARIVNPDGTGLGAGWTAQLYGGPEGSALADLQTLFPTTTFRTNSESAKGYVNPVEVTVPGVPPSARATLVVRAFLGTSFETSSLRGESAPFTVTVGGGILPPADLVGLAGFTVNGSALTVTATAGANGSISPSGTMAKFQGQSEAFAAMPDASYTVDQWTVNGTVVQAGGITYTLSNIQTNTAVSVTFKPVSFDGTVVFSNRIVGVVDARVTLASGAGAGAGWTAQLYGGPEGTAVANLKPLFPTTTFRTTSEATLGYVNAVDVTVPGVHPNGKATLVMRVYDGATLETSSVHGESAPVTVVLGGGMMPPADLVGLQGFTLPAEPLPSAAAGSVTFDNRVLGVVDARVVLSDGTGLGAGWTAQLYGGPEGGTLAPLLPTTTFRTSSSAAMGYVEPVVVSVPGVPAGSKATLRMTAYIGQSFEKASLFGQSKPFTVTLGGGLLPPANLVGLTGFTVASRLPLIVKPPASQSVSLGSSATFGVTATGTEPLSYQWRFNGGTLIGATAPSFTIANAQLSNAGSYTVTVRNSAGAVTSAAAILTVLSTTPKGDLTGDGFADLIFENDDGYLAIWEMDGAKLNSARFLTPNTVRDEGWQVVGTGRFNADAHEDLLFQHQDGWLAVWYMDGTKRLSGAYLDPVNPGDDDWRVAGTGDFNNDGKTDVLFQHQDGTLAVWFMDGVKAVSSTLLKPEHPDDDGWRVVATGDFNGDGKTDLIFQHEDGTLAYWFLDGIKLVQSGLLTPHHPHDKRWRVVSAVDLNRDGKLDLVFQHGEDGTLAVWFMDGTTLTSAQLLNPSRPGGSWRVVGP